MVEVAAQRIERARDIRGLAAADLQLAGHADHQLGLQAGELSPRPPRWMSYIEHVQSIGQCGVVMSDVVFDIVSPQEFSDIIIVTLLHKELEHTFKKPVLQ